MRGDKQQQRIQYDRKRDKQEWRKWYRTARWQAISKAQLSAHPDCRMCMSNGITTKATVCDHIDRHKGDPIKFWAGPFQSLCAHHHSSTKQRMEAQEAKGAW